MTTRATARASQRFGMTNPKRQLFDSDEALRWIAKERVRAMGRSRNADSKSAA